MPQIEIGEGHRGNIGDIMDNCNCHQMGNDTTGGNFTITYPSGTGDYWSCPYCDPPRCPGCGRILSPYPYYHLPYRNPWVDPYYTWGNGTSCSAKWGVEDFELAEMGMDDYCQELNRIDIEP